MNYTQVWYKLIRNNGGISTVESPDPRTPPMPVLYTYHETRTGSYSVTIWTEIKNEEEADDLELRLMLKAIAEYFLLNS